MGAGETGGGSLLSGRSSPLPSFGKNIVRILFECRHNSPEAREMARGAIRNAKAWTRAFGGRRGK